MKILGICHDVLICSAGVVVDGNVVAAIPEERLDRVKQSRVFPTRAIAECLRMAGLRLDDIDEVAIAWNPGIDAETTPAGYVTGRRWRTEHFLQVPTRFLAMSGQPAASAPSLANLWQGGPPITYLDHYKAHVGNAVYLSPYETCAVAVLDGRAERQTGLLARVAGTDIEVIEEVAFPHSLGLFYGAVTQFLGFRPDSDEWKVMALAAYASADNPYIEPMRQLIRVDERGRFAVDLDYFAYFNFWDRRMISDRFTDRFGPPRRPGEPLTTRHEQIAAAMQCVFEDTAAAILCRLHQRTGLDQLVVSGGCFMNSVFNGQIEQVTPFRSCYITSCPDDSGTSIGAALYLHALRTGTRPRGADGLRNDWGMGYSDAECQDRVARYKLPNAAIIADEDELAHSAAADLIAGKLIGWFQGRAEFGQRALGNRSILADPRSADVRDKVNGAVKFREHFRPFAPAILAEHVADYFDCAPGTQVPFMERVLRFRPDKRAAVPAVVHADGTGRLQTVGQHAPPRYRAVIRSFFAQTGVPLLLNTSFNLNGEPMVNAPEDAIRTFYACGLDVLYLGNVRVAK